MPGGRIIVRGQSLCEMEMAYDNRGLLRDSCVNEWGGLPYFVGPFFNDEETRWSIRV